MRHTTIFLSLILLILLMSTCQNEAKYCEVNRLAELCFYNETMDTVSVTVDGEFKSTLFPDSEYCEFFQTGNRIYSAKTLDGLICWSDTMLVSTCQRENIDLFY